MLEQAQLGNPVQEHGQARLPSGWSVTGSLLAVAVSLSLKEMGAGE